MTTEHPITPPPELVQQWLTEGHHQDYCSATNHAIAQAARWGADQELEACVEWLPSDLTINGESLRDARRPKPPSLAEQALNDLDVLLDIAKREGVFSPPGTIRLALERLQELEQQENNDN